MAARLLIFTVAVLCCVHEGRAQNPNLNLSPSKIELAPNQSETGVLLTITCTTLATGTLLSMDLKRRSQTPASETLLVSALAGSTNGIAQIQPPVTALGGSVGGSINEKRLTLTLPRAKCSDAMEYICTTVVFTASAQTNSTPVNLTGEVTPGTVTLTHNSVGIPSGVNNGFAVGDQAEFICNAFVGSITSNTRIEFVWQYETFKSWTDYDRPEDIVTDPLPTPPASDTCKTQTMISRLNRNVTIDDSLRGYRCFIRRNTINYQDLAGEAKFDTVTYPGSQANTGTSSANTAKADVGMIIGIIIAILVVIAVVVVIVIFLLRRKRQKREAGAHDTEHKPETVPPPYTTTNNDPSVTYSKPNRFNKDKGDQPRSGSTGHSNKGMDDEHDSREPHEKEKPRREEKPRRYENDFNQGQRNRGYDREGYDDRAGRRYSSDDGNTDPRMNTSQGSIGVGDPSVGTAI